MSSCRQLAYQACALRLLCSFDQGLFDLVNKILNEAGAAKAHDVYINLYPASTGRLRPHQDRKQVQFIWIPWSSLCLLAVGCLLCVAVRYVQSEYSLFKRRQRAAYLGKPSVIVVVCLCVCVCMCVLTCMVMVRSKRGTNGGLCDLALVQAVSSLIARCWSSTITRPNQLLRRMKVFCWLQASAMPQCRAWPTCSIDTPQVRNERSAY